MSDPTVRHWVCPECHSHQPLYSDGRLYPHAASEASGSRCPGSYDYPNRVVSGRYSEGSQFESCPAATGEPAFEVQRCGDFSDGAHRCGLNRSHIKQSAEASDLDGATHRCTCGWGWFITSLASPTQRAPDSCKHETRHVAGVGNLCVKCGKVA